MHKRNKNHFYLNLKQIACFSLLSGCLIQLTQGQSHNKQQVGMASAGRIQNNIECGFDNCFRIANGKVWAWGWDGAAMGEDTNNLPTYMFNGSLGIGKDVFNTNIPTIVAGINGNGFLADVIQISAGALHTLALLSNGRVLSWGNNGDKQLGIGDVVNNKTNVPMQVLGPGGLGLLQNIVAIAAGGGSSFALKSDGTVWAWGHNGYGGLGNGNNSTEKFPVKVVALSNVCNIVAGIGHTLALKSDGTVWSWGRGDGGALGTGFKINSNIPVRAIGLSNIIDISSKFDTCLALKDDGTVWTWGHGSWNDLVTDNHTNIALPSQVLIDSSNTLTNIVDISCGWNYSLCLAGNGKIWGWGNNDKLGNNNVVNGPSTVVTADNINNKGFIVSISSGYGHNLALDANGNVYGWGKNEGGQMGIGVYFTTTNQPQQTYQYTNGILNTAAGAGHGLALKANGRVYSWGNGFRGELGNVILHRKSGLLFNEHIEFSCFFKVHRGFEA